MVGGGFKCLGDIHKVEFSGIFSYLSSAVVEVHDDLTKAPPRDVMRQWAYLHLGIKQSLCDASRASS